MKLYILTFVLSVLLLGSLGAEVENDDTIDIDGGDLNAMPVALIGGGDVEELGSGVPAENGMGPTTDDEDGGVEGSGTTAGSPDISMTTLSLVPDNKIPDGPINGGTIPNAIDNGPTYNEANPGENNAFEGNETTETEHQNFIGTVMGNPAILAGMVGAVVLILLTVVLLFLFVIYRIKKKDEGSYSLDEPHKVKDPTAYWKDTKEFYA